MSTFNQDVVSQIMDDLGDVVIRLIHTKIATWVAQGISEDDIAAALYLTFDSMNKGFSEDLDEDFKNQVSKLL